MKGPLDSSPRETNVARSHILGGERVAEQRLVGEVASGHTEPVPDVRRGDVDARRVLHETSERVRVQVDWMGDTRNLDDQVRAIQGHVDGILFDVRRRGRMPVGRIRHRARPWCHSTRQRLDGAQTTRVCADGIVKVADALVRR